MRRSSRAGRATGPRNVSGMGRKEFCQPGWNQPGSKAGGDAADNHIRDLVSAGGEGGEEGAGRGVAGDQDYVAGLDISGSLIGVHKLVCVCSAPVEKGCCHAAIVALFRV